jgi:Holliday junction resolvase RusA-like endonuclease
MGPAAADSGTIEPFRARAVSLTILGQCYSMKNSKIRHVKHPKAQAFERDFALQVPPEAKLGLGSRDRLLRAVITVCYPSWRQDVDLAIVYDMLQKTGVVSNDRWIRERHEFGLVDAENPRVEIDIEEI